MPQAFHRSFLYANNDCNYYQHLLSFKTKLYLNTFKNKISYNDLYDTIDIQGISSFFYHRDSIKL